MLRKKPFGVALVLAALVFALGGTAVFAQDPDPLTVTVTVDNVVPPDCVQVQFDATVSGGTTPYTFQWDFGDGSPFGTVEDPTHTYEPGEYDDVTLTVTDSSTPALSTSVDLTVVVDPVIATATATPSEAILDEVTGEVEIDFTGGVSGGEEPYTTFGWVFDDFDDVGDTSTLQDPSYTYDEGDVGVHEVEFTVTDTNGCEGTDTVTVVISSEEGLNPVAEALASYFDVPNDEINDLHEDGWGYGEIAFAYWLSWITGEDVDAIMEMRDDMGWGQILKDLLDSSLGWLNLGAIMSGQADARLEALAEECGLTVEELQEVFQESEPSPSPITLRHACRLAAETDEEVSFEDILAMHADGMSWGAIRQALSLPAACGLEWEEVQGFLDDFSLADTRRACRLAVASGEDVEVILGMRADGMSWRAIRQELGLSGGPLSSDEATTTDTSSHGRGHGKGGNPNK